MPHSRLATVADRDRALRTIVRGFTDDPLLRFFFPTDERYASGAPVFFGFLIDLNLEGGEVLIADEGLAAALWTPPGGPGIAEAEIDDGGKRRCRPTCAGTRSRGWIGSKRPRSA